MLTPAILGIARHLMTAVGTALATTGWIEAGQVETFVGAAVALIGIAWSVIEKRAR